MTPGSPSPQPPLRRSSPGQRGLPQVQRSLSAPLGRCPRAGARPQRHPHSALSPWMQQYCSCMSRGPRLERSLSSLQGSFLIATPPFQFSRTGRDRRSGPDSAAGVSPGRHFVFRDGSGAARERGRFHEGARRRRFPRVQGSQGSSRRRLQLGQAILTTGG
ncbi:hypothetical protein NDU88_005659 [Pleurodeles waltl]|uniref:Uncharacterized protein n=1 Tax=Pleurodeles waltl TaxID=8319 RepID=A0AAV7RPU6_PLEWA|nr:hypothetical protein NDU88_005659 [Pleurodeles waltl]